MKKLATAALLTALFIPATTMAEELTTIMDIGGGSKMIITTSDTGTSNVSTAYRVGEKYWMVVDDQNNVQHVFDYSYTDQNSNND